MELNKATSAIPCGYEARVLLFIRFLLARSRLVQLRFILAIAELLSAVLQWLLTSLFWVLVVVQVAVIWIKLLVCTHTVRNVLTGFLLTFVVGVFGQNLLRGHFKLLKEKLS